MANMIGVSNVAQEIVKAWIGDANGKAQEIVAGWIGVNGIAQAIFSSGPNIYVFTGASGTLGTSADGITWTVGNVKLNGASDTSTTYTKILYGNGAYVAVSGSNLRYSDSDFDFKDVTISTSVARDIAFGNGKFVAFHKSGNYQPQYSTDGKTWTACSSSYYGTSDQLHFVNGYFVTMGTNGIYYSSDGISWTSAGETMESEEWTNIVKLGSRYIAFDFTNQAIYYSTNGRTGWTKYGSDMTGHLEYTYMLASNDTCAVAVGNGSARGGVYIDTNLNFTSATGLSASANYQNVIYVDKFVTVGYKGRVAYSTDGKTWTTVTTGTTKNLRGLCFAA